MQELTDVRSKLAEFMGRLKDAESDIMKRASRLWQSKLRSEEEIDALRDEVEDVARAFEGCQTDLEDLRLMRGVLNTYKRSHYQLSDERLHWQEFESLSVKLRREAEAAFGEQEIPWPPNETLSSFADIISKQRKQISQSWIQTIESEASTIASMSAVDANRLHAKASTPPATLTEQHLERLAKLVKKVERRLDSLALDWLVEKFRELHDSSKRKFLQLVAKIDGES